MSINIKNDLIVRGRGVNLTVLGYFSAGDRCVPYNEHSDHMKEMKFLGSEILTAVTEKFYLVGNNTV